MINTVTWHGIQIQVRTAHSKRGPPEAASDSIYIRGCPLLPLLVHKSAGWYHAIAVGVMHFQLCHIAADSNSLSISLCEKAATIEQLGNLPHNSESRGIRQTQQSTGSHPNLVAKNIEYPKRLLKILIYDFLYYCPKA